MSNRYSITLIVDDVDDACEACLQKINAWLVERGTFGLEPLSIANDRNYGCKVFGGMNRGTFALPGFARFVLGLPWEYPDAVVLVLHEGDVDVVQVYRGAGVEE